MPAGYSGTPLAKKLGIKPGHRIATVNEPSEFRGLLVDLPDGAAFDGNLDHDPDIILGFFNDAAELEARLPDLEQAAFPDRVIWLAWPKKSSGVATDVTGDVVRATVLRTHLVDVKVCAISDTWSGLKVVWRKEHRHERRGHRQLGRAGTDHDEFSTESGLFSNGVEQLRYRIV